ncbi:thiol:disulfide interchange protein DsbA/DsbL [Kitasatospora sp. NPDC059571]|uniref:thiol:disulfide interchange protein DsbA/DsbL n=1 Tax=Kitasatospora sp. NPDC059571 TaxID=3346871 RepID=UPI0036CEC406
MKLLRTATALAVLTAGLAPATATAAAPDAPRDPVHAGPQAPRPRAAERREAVEFFWYGCRHCAQFEPALERWAAEHRDGAVLRRVPAVWPGGPDEQVQRAHARLYYTLERLGAVDRLQQAVFRAVREEHRDLTTEDRAAAWALTQGLDPAAFRAAYRSADVDRLTDDAPDRLVRDRITELPTVVVGDERTSPSTADGVERMPAAMDGMLTHP